MQRLFTFETEPFTGYQEPDEDAEMFHAGLSYPEEGEVNRSSREFIRWVQRSLNQILGLNLAVDGIPGPQTRSAIRYFQQRAGLSTDGIVGPQTEQALIAAGGQTTPRTAPSAPTREPAPYTPGVTRRAFEDAVARDQWRNAFLNLNGLNMFEMLRACDELTSERRCLLLCQRHNFTRLVNMPRINYAITVIQDNIKPSTAPGDLASTGQVQVVDEFLFERRLRQAAILIATLERDRWGNGTLTETQAGIRSVLREYWGYGVNRAVSDAEAGNTQFHANNPWSAAFISWVLRKAGAGNTFSYSAAHANYIAWAKQNRLTNTGGFFKAYRITELRPRPGDLVCKSRQGSGATYENIRC